MVKQSIIPPQDSQLLRDYIYQVSGITFSGSQESLFEKRILRRIDAIGVSSPKEYYQYLKFDLKKGEELDALLNELTVNETYFFRETPQIELFKDGILPEIKERYAAKKRFTLWSAACSTGCEPYSLAMLVEESGFFDSSWKIQVIGTDINTEVLSLARRGVYSESMFRSTPAAMKEKYFTKAHGGYSIDEKIRRMVRFSHVNLYSEQQTKAIGGAAVIFCRNVLIYFDLESKKKVAENLYKVLDPGGYLFVGQSETLFKVTTLFQIKPMGGVLLYSKP